MTGPSTSSCRCRQARRVRLDEQVRATAIRVCTAAGLSPGGKKLAAKGVGGAATDLAAVIILVNQAVKRFLGNPTGRRELSIEELEHVTAALETIADEVQADIIKRVA